MASVVSHGAIQLKTVFGYDDSLDVQAGAVAATFAYAGPLTWGIVVIVEKTVGFRMSEADQGAGMDHALHREHGCGLLNPNGFGSPR